MSDLSFYNKTERPWLNARLTNAAIVGHTTETSAKIWVRAWEEDKNGEPTDGAGLYWLVLSSERIDGRRGQPMVERDAAGVFRVMLVAPDGTRTPLPGVVQTRSISLRYATDLTGTLTLGDLQPDQVYHYALFAGFDRAQRWELGNDQDLFFRTQVASARRVTFGVFSCHQPFTRFGVRQVEMFSALHEELEQAEGDHVLAIGDQIYSDGFSEADIWEWLKKVQAEPALTPEDMISWFRDVYRGFWGFKGLQDLLARYPTYMILDDHEIADGWGSLTPQEVAEHKLGRGAKQDPARALRLVQDMFAAALKVYEEYQHAHNPDTAPGVYDYGFQSSFVSTYVLDMRSAHDANQPDGMRLLGDAQFQRLRAWLGALTVESKVVFLVTPVPVVHFRANFVNSGVLNNVSFIGARDDLRDEWEHDSNRTERNKLLELLSEFSQSRGVPVMILSGDVHMSAAFELWDTAKPNAHVFQLTTSGITYNGPARVPPILDLHESLTHHNGPLAGTNNRWQVYRLQTDPHHNFAIVKCDRDPAAGVSVTWSVFVPGKDELSLGRLKRLQIFPPTGAR